MTKNNTVQQNIPQGWKNHIVSDLCDSLDNRRIPITKSDRISGDVPYYGATGIIDYVADHTFDEEILLIGEDGADWSPYANKAFVVRGRSWVNNHAHVLKCKNVSTHEYLEQYLNWKKLDVYTTGGTRKKLNKEVLMSIPVCLPESKKEQQKIAEILGTVDEDIAKTQEVIEAIEKLKRGLMQQLFTRGIGHTKFKKTKIGLVPSEWEIKKISNIGDVITGNTPKTSERSNYGEDYLFVSPKDIGSIKYINDSENKLSKKGYDTTRKIPKGSVLVVCIGSTIGKIALAGIELSTNQQINSVVVKDEYSNEFIYYQLLYRRQDIIGRRSTQAVPIINKTDFSETYLALPETKEEQNKIAEILSAVDEKISVNKKLKEKLTLLKKGLMQDLLSGKVRVNNLLNR